MFTILFMITAFIALILWARYLKDKTVNINQTAEENSARRDAINAREKMLDQQEYEINSKIEKYKSIDSDLDRLHNEKSELEKVVNDIDDNVTSKLVESEIDIDLPDDVTSTELKNQLSLLRNEEKELPTTDISAHDIKKRTLNALKRKILTPFNSEVNGILNNLTISNVDSSRKKIVSTFEKINKIFADDKAQLTSELLDYKLKELEITYQYLVKKNQEKEQQRAIKEQMVEEERARRELEAENKKLDKEEKQFNNELKRLLKYLDNSTDAVQSQLYADEIASLKEKISEVQTKKANIENRQANTRAGFVYIISNIGSFGENVFKIGMTKRLNPMDRINELSSASVPFIFDVHAMIFSDDAPKLENELHQAFSSNAVNKINPRKEFYNVNIKDIENEIEKHHPSAIMELTKTAKADEYRRSLELANK